MIDNLSWSYTLCEKGFVRGVEDSTKIKFKEKKKKLLYVIYNA